MAACITFPLARYLPHPVLPHIQKLQSLASAQSLTAPYSSKPHRVSRTQSPQTSLMKRQAIRYFHITYCRESPQPSASRASTPAPLASEQYHKLADKYIENLVEVLENLQDEREEIDCEYSVGSSSSSYLVDN